MSLHRRKTANGIWRSIVVALLILMPLVVSAPAVGAEDYGTWRAEYYDNQNLSGAPKLVRTEYGISYDWGLGSPDPSIPNEHFSARWTAFLRFDAGLYRFLTYTDDGVRLWIDETLVLDQWRTQPVTYNEIHINLATGYHYVRMEYFDNTDRAVAKLNWERVSAAPPPTTGWQAEYYNNTWLGGTPALTRTDADINFNWGYGSPGAGVAADSFSARWTRQLYFDAGYYTFYILTDDGLRVWLDSQIIIDRWFDQSAKTYSTTVYVAQGSHYLRVEYYEHLGVAQAQVWWQRTGVPPAPPGAEVVVDDKSAGFKKSGLAYSWYEANIGYGGHIYWTYNSVYQVYNYATWTPILPGAGYYTVYAYIPSQYADTRNVRYRIFHNGQRHDAWIAQYKYFSKWVSLGTYYFHAGGGEYVYLSDNTHEAYASKKIAFDAVKFVPSSGVTTPTPTPVPWTGCAITPQAGFGRVWSGNATVRSRLGCPLEPEKSVWSAEENFQYGYMFWRSDTRFIYALYQNGTWQTIADTWQEGEPESDPSIVPPWGYYQPVRGFGKAWRGEPGVRDRLGWATSTERGFNASIQSFERGLMIWSNVKGIYVLYQDGTWQRFD